MSEKPNYILGEKHKGREFFRAYDLVVNEGMKGHLMSLDPGENPQLKAYVDTERVSRAGTAYLNGRLSGPKAVTKEMVGIRGKVQFLIGDQHEHVTEPSGIKKPNFSGYESRLLSESTRLTKIVSERISASSRVELNSEDLKGVGLEVWGISDLSLSDSNNIQAPFAIDRAAWVNTLLRRIRTCVLESHSVQVDFTRTDSKEVPVVITGKATVAAK